MQIQSSLDWNSVHSELRTQIGQLPYNPDLRKMLNNISNMVSELSSLEVETRRLNKPEYTKEKVDEINKSIDHLEKLLLIAKLVS
jgi:cob(I)alamin adenosyltransferase